MVEERIVFEKGKYLALKDYDALQEKIIDCARKDNKIVIDFSQTVVNGDFYTAIVSAVAHINEEKGKENLLENLVFIFESKKSQPYQEFDMNGLTEIIKAEFKPQEPKEEIFVFEKDYLGAMDYEESLENKLRECMQGKYNLILDFTKLKGGVNGDFYCSIFNSCVDEIEKQGKSPATQIENLTLLFQSRKAFAYETIELIGVQEIFNCQFNDEKTIVFEQAYIATTDHATIEEKLIECMQGKYKLVLDFSKAKEGAQSDFYQAMIGTIIIEADKLGKDWPEYVQERITFVFESKNSKANYKLEELGLNAFLKIDFKDKK